VETIWDRDRNLDELAAYIDRYVRPDTRVGRQGAALRPQDRTGKDRRSDAADPADGEVRASV
jgi:hypothetical protein